MTSFYTEQELARAERKLERLENHGIFKIIERERANVARLKAELADQDANEVKLSDVAEKAPEPAAEKRKAATEKDTPPVRRRRAPAARTTAAKAKDET